MDEQLDEEIDLNEIYTEKLKNLTKLIADIALKEIDMQERLKQEGREPQTLLKCIYSEKVLKDTAFLIGNGRGEGRYSNLVLRNLIEQVIEFAYLMKFPGKIGDYMGSHGATETADMVAKMNMKELKGIYRGLCSRRYASEKSGKRLPLIEMAKAAGEADGDGSSMLLYDWYGMLSEYAHNSYYMDILNGLGESEEDRRNSQELTDMIMCLRMISLEYAVSTFYGALCED